MLTHEEFASLLLVGYTPAMNGPPPVIPAEHSARLIALGYMADIAGRLRMTTPGRTGSLPVYQIRMSALIQKPTFQLVVQAGSPAVQSGR
jgi:hypothetical protein